MAQNKISVTDRSLLIALQSNPELSINDLADLVNMSHSACWKRIKKLETEGFIKGKAILLNQKSLGLNVTVIIQVTLETNIREAIDAFEQSLHAHPQIVLCYSMGGQSDYIMKVVERSIESYETFLREKLANLPYVASLNSNFTLRAVKNTTSLPI